jgi:hypothetical protein
MLRWLVLLLALANAVFLAWSLGWLDDVTGLRASGDREPERLARQVRPETIRILPPGTLKTPAPGAAAIAPPVATPSVAPSAAPSVAPAPNPPVQSSATSQSGSTEPAALPFCLEAGPFSAAQVGAAIASLQSNLPSGSWSQLKTERSALWMVYMGKLIDPEAMTRRQDELRRLKVDYEVLRSPSELAPGLSLGRFEIRGNANNLLDQLTKRGVRNARVIETVPAASSHVLRVDKPSASVVAQLSAMPAELFGKGFGPCARP